MMSSLNIISYKVRSLISAIRCANIMGELKHLKAEVILLQETHFLLDKSQNFFSKDFPVWYYRDSPVSRAKGVAIGFARGVRFDLEERKTDPEGRYLFLRGKLNRAEYSLANIYGPNKNPNRYLLGVLTKFMEFKKGGGHNGRDFNLCLEPEKDNTSHARETGMVWMNKMKKKLHQCQLVDA